MVSFQPVNMNDLAAIKLAWWRRTTCCCNDFLIEEKRNDNEWLLFVGLLMIDAASASKSCRWTMFAAPPLLLPGSGAACVIWVQGIRDVASIFVLIIVHISRRGTQRWVTGSIMTNCITRLLAIDFLTRCLQVHRFLVSVQALTNSMKATDLKLTQEGVVFCLFQKARHHASAKHLGQMDSECLSMGLLRDDTFITGLGHLFKHVMEFDQERGLHASGPRFGDSTVRCETHHIRFQDCTMLKTQSHDCSASLCGFTASN
jgi:hypothetical protein